MRIVKSSLITKSNIVIIQLCHKCFTFSAIISEKFD